MRIALGPGFLIIAMPFGMFWLYVLLIVLYALLQFRKARRRRAILTIAVAATIMIQLAMHLNIA